MKPWRPYWKGCEKAIGSILNHGEGFAVDDQIPVSEWISELNYLQLAAGNDNARVIASWLSEKEREKTLEDFSILFSGEEHRFQLYLRCLYGLDFCRGRVGKRKEFNWDRDPKIIYCDLLVDRWMSEALHWISKCYPSERRGENRYKIPFENLRINPKVIGLN